MIEPVFNTATQQSIPRQAEADLITAAQHDPQAFETLYRLYVQPVYRYLFSRIGSRAEAEDATAQTFLAALDGIRRYRHNGHFAAWLFSIARRKAADHFRGRRGQVSLEGLQEIPLEADYLQDAIHNERAELLSGLIAALPENERELLRLRYTAGLPFSEMGRLLGRSEGAVKKALYRLLARLYRQLEEGNV
jgi:RNA polymerase sigma-70 factor (ECF subfamily)